MENKKKLIYPLLALELPLQMFSCKKEYGSCTNCKMLLSKMPESVINNLFERVCGTFKIVIARHVRGVMALKQRIVNPM